MRLKFALLPLILTLAASLHAQSPTPAELGPRSSALDSQLFYQLLLGELSARSNEPGAAFSLLLDAARKTNDPAIYLRAVQVALQARAGESALQAARAWSQAIPASREANRFVLQILLGLNRVADTLEPLKREIVLTPAIERRNTIWAIPGAFERVSDRQLAVTTVQKALTRTLVDPDLGATAWAVVGRMWLSAADKPAALNAAAKAQGIDPGSEHAALLALSMMAPDMPQAEAMVRKHLPKARPEFRMAYIKTLLDSQREADALAELQAISNSTPNYADAWLIQGAMALQAGQLTVAERHLQRYLDLIDATPEEQQPVETKRGRSQAYFSMALIAQQRKDLSAADAWLQRVSNPEDVLRAQIRRAALMAEQGHVDEAIALIQSQTERSANDASIKRSAQLQILREQKLFDRASILLKEAIAQNPEDLDLVYDLAMVSEKLGHMDEMESLLRSLMAAKPDDPHPYNALGYSLADRNMRLPESIALITKALQLAPNDPFITDSLAWAQFRSGNKDEALQLLQGAFKARPDAEIAAHLGEVLWAMDRHAEAVQVFKEGIKLNPANDTLMETLKRLRVPL